MASPPNLALRAALPEVAALRDAALSRHGERPVAPILVRTLGRAGVVLLGAHMEEYVKSINVLAVDHLNDGQVRGEMLPEPMRERHTVGALRVLMSPGSGARTSKLVESVANNAWLWSAGGSGRINHRLLLPRTTVKRENLLAYFALWDVPDIYAEIASTPSARSALANGLETLITRRNKIAHGNLTVTASAEELTDYLELVERFGDGVDVVLARRLTDLTGHTPPW